MAGTPVDYDPFATSSSGGTPVDYDPFNEKPTGVSPTAETEGGAALMYPTGKRRPVAEPTDINTTKVAEAIFGKGTPMNVPEGERYKKIGETALATGGLTAGAKIASPYLIRGGEAISKLPGTPAKVLGGGMTAAGTLAKGIGLREVGAMTAAGGAGESTEQLLSAAGLPREYQVLGGMGITGLAQLATQYPEQIANYLTTGVRGAVPALIRSLGIKVDDQATATANRLRTEAIDRAKADLLSGASPEASKTLDTALKGGIAARQKAEQAKAIIAQQAEKNQIEKLKGVQTTQVKTQEQALADIERQQVNFGASVPTESLANNLQADVVMTQKPLLDKRSADYKAQLLQATQNAEAKEAAGEFWQTSEGGDAVRKYWQNKIDNKKYSPESEKAITKVLDDIYGKADEVPRSITAVDETVRQLGDKASRESTGYAAIGDALAGQLRKSITEGVVEEQGKKQVLGKGLYKWEPGYGQAKEGYRKASEDLAAWETKSAQKTLGDETKSLSVLNQYFTSRKGFDNLVSELGGDKAKAAQYGTQYAVNQVKDKTPAQIDKWIASPKNGWIKDVPGLESKIRGHAQTIGGLEAKAVRAGEDITRLGKEIPQLQANQKTWNSNVDKWAQEQYKTIIGDSKPGIAFERILSGTKVTPAQTKALSAYIGQNPEARAAVPDAVRNILSKESPKTIMDTFDNRIAPTLEGTGIIKKNELANIRQQAIKIYEADVRDYTIPKAEKTIKAINFLYGILAQRAASQITPNPQEQQ